VRNISDKRCRENQNTDVLCSNISFENRTIYEKMWKNIVEPDKPKMAVFIRIRFACWVTRLGTHSE